MLPSFPCTDTVKEFSARRRALQSRYKSLQEHFHQIRSRYLLIVCAWCQQHVRWQRKKDAASPIHTSHGICLACVVHVLGELDVMTRNAPGTAPEPCAIMSCIEYAEERNVLHMSGDASKSPVDKEPQPAIGEALLRRAHANCLQAQVVYAAARAARQCAKEVWEGASGFRARHAPCL
jgi:hypothetical protein